MDQRSASETPEIGLGDRFEILQVAAHEQATQDGRATEDPELPRFEAFQSRGDQRLDLRRCLVER